MILRLSLLLLITISLFSQSNAEKIDNLLKNYVEFNQFNGSVLVAEDGDIIHKKGYGYANFEWDIKNTSDTKFRLASVTKQFTAMLIMLEVQDKRIDLIKPITEYIPNYPKKTGDLITVHHLLTHTAGIPNYTSFPNFFKEKSRNFYSPQKLMEEFWNMELEFNVGSKYSYSNSGYHLLGVILENVTGKTYDTLLKERIFEPLEMQNSGYDLTKPLLKKRAYAYQKSGNTIVNADYIDMSIPYSAGSIYSTVEDLYKWDQSLYNHDLLSEELTEKMFTPLLSNYAYGWIVTDNKTESGEKYKVISHSGGVNGFSTRIMRYVTQNDLIVVLDNTSGGKNTEIVRNIYNILNDLPTTEPKQTISQLVDGKTGDDLYKILTSNKSNENEINRMGYNFIAAKKLSEAIIVLKFNTEKHPKSANAFDSLGEAYREKGEKEKSISAYKMAYKLDSSFTSAINALADLGVKVQKKEKDVIIVTESILKTYIGVYQLNPNFSITVTLENGTLITQATGQDSNPIFPESQTKFFLKVVNAQLEFNKDQKGKIVSATLFQGGREMIAKRL